ncbi:MAG: rod shape-determining protein MreC [Sphingomonadales bacterium]|nr:rod shape-determining protein MreC [Sphingomonadales bacterium]
MKRPIATSSASKPRGRGVGRRWLLVSLTVLAVALFVASQLNFPLVKRLRVTIADGAGVVLEVLSRPVDGIQDLYGSVKRLTEMADENEALRAENERLKQWQQAAMRLEEENRRLAELVNLQSSRPNPVATARVIAVTGGPFARTVLINAGSRAGVRRDLAVVDREGVVGRVIEAGFLSSRVLLISDINSRIPVRIAGQDANGILVGDNADELRLEFLSRGAEPKAGDLLLTSGHGGIFPPDIPVATVTAVAPSVIAEPVAGLDALGLVQVIEFAAAQPPAETADSGAGDGP